MSDLPPGFVLDQPSSELPPGFVLDQAAAPSAADTQSAHATSGPTDSALTDAGRRVASAGINAVSGLRSMIPQTGIEIDPNAGNPLSAFKHSVNHPAAFVPPEQKTVADETGRDALFKDAGVTEYIPATEAGRIGQGALTAAPFAMLGGGLWPVMAGGAVSQGAVDAAPDALKPYAGLVGQLAGAHGLNMAQRAAAPLMPGAMDPQTLALAKTAVNDYGMQIPLAKTSNSPFVRYLDSTVRRMPFSGYGAMDEANQAAFQRGAASTFGEDANKITPDVLNNAYGRIGGVMNDVAARTNVNMDQPFLNNLADIHQRAGEVGLDPGPAQAVRSHIDKLLDIAQQNGGSIPGNVYQNLTKRGESLDVLQGNRSTVAGNLGGQIRDALDDALQRSASPDDVAALQQARTQYKALKTVEPLTMRADAIGGATPSTGDISPAGLLGRVNQQYNNAARANLGDIPLKDLAQIGQRFLKEPNSSGTAEREGIQNLIGHGGQLATALGAAAVGHEAGVPLHVTIPSLAAALIGPPIIGSMLRNPSSINRAVNGSQVNNLAQLLASQQHSGGAVPVIGPSAP